MLTQSQRNACNLAVLSIVEARHQIEHALAGFSSIDASEVQQDLEHARSRLSVWEGLIEDHLREDDYQQDEARQQQGTREEAAACLT